MYVCMYVCMYVMYSKMINRRFLRDILHSIFSFFCLFFQTETTTATLVARSAANVHPELDWASEDGVVGTTSAWNASQHLKLEGHITYSLGGAGYMTCKFSISELTSSRRTLLRKHLHRHQRHRRDLRRGAGASPRQRLRLHGVGQGAVRRTPHTLHLHTPHPYHLLILDKHGSRQNNQTHWHNSSPSVLGWLDFKRISCSHRCLLFICWIFFCWTASDISTFAEKGREFNIFELHGKSALYEIVVSSIFSMGQFFLSQNATRPRCQRQAQDYSKQFRCKGDRRRVLVR